MNKIYKFRVYPTKNQIKLIDSQLEICRILFNKTLKRKIDAYSESKTNLSLFQLQKELTGWKHHTPELKTVYSQVLHTTQERVDLAFKGFFRRLRQAKPGEKFGFPKEKAEGRLRSLTYPQNGFKFFSKAIELSKIGKINAVLHRTIEGRVCRLSLVKYPSGKFFICVTVEIMSKNVNPSTSPTRAVGIDLGVSHFAVLSDGVVEDSPKPLRKVKQKISNRQSKNKPVTLLYEKATNRQSDFLHKLVNKLIQKYDTISVENLNVKRMLKKNPKFSNNFREAIVANGWSNFINMLQYKAVMAGKRVVLVDPKYTSQDCSRCGQRKKIELAERSYYCEVCGLLMDRDLNAAHNILRVGLAQLAG